jgi:signal transduction histidine kinase
VHGVRYGHLVSRLGQLLRRYGFDALIVLAAVESSLEVAFRKSSHAPTSSGWFAVPATALVVLPLLLRRRYPFAAPTSLWVLAATFSLIDGRLMVYSTTVFIAGLAAAFLLGNLRDPVKTRAGLAIVVGCAAVIVYDDPYHTAAELLFIPLLFSLGWLGGFALREWVEQAEAAEERAARAEWERDASARIAVAEERARIARELHDIVAHAVSVMVLQTGAVRHKLPQAMDEEREALNGVERAGRTALADMRRLLTAMREDGEDVELTPQPGLDGLDALAEQIRRAGLAVRIHVEGERVPLPPGIDLSAYRIVQEGLTNALKHAHATAVDVTIRFGPQELEIEVRDDGTGSSRSDGLGHGLVGVRERVKIFGGEMRAGSSDGGGFVLDARLPLTGARA